MKKASIFLVITFLLCWLVAFWGFGRGVKLYSASGLAMAIYCMFTPLISACITQKLIFHQNIMKPLGISFRINRWFFVALILPAVLAIGSTATSLLLPGVSFTSDPTAASIFEFFGKTLPPEQVVALNRSVANLPMHPFLLVLISGTIAGLTANAIIAFGEELGWRGLLLRESARWGFWRASFMIGAVWGLWHLPFILHGHNYPDHPVVGVLMMTLWTVLCSPLMVYVCIRSNSVLSAALMHGALNGTAIAPLTVLKGGNDILVGVTGFAGMAVLVGLNIVILLFGKPRIWHNKWMERTFDNAAHP